MIYNTDGTLCTTYRDDVVPFRGVRSFAVETATTNLIGHTNGRFNSVTGAGTTPPTVELVSMKTPWGNEAWKVTIPANNATGYNGCRATTNSFPITAGTYYSYFTYVLFEGSLQPSGLYIYPTGVWGMEKMVLDSSKNIGSWQYFFWENSAPTLTGFDYFTYKATTTSTVARTFYVAVGQFEQKPFASSFVDGSRPTGIIAVPFHIDLNTEDWVVSFWHKMTNTYSFAEKIIFSIDGLFHLNTYFPSEGKYNWVCRNTDNVMFKATSTTTVDTNWNFIVLVKNGLNFKVYINGILEITLNYNGTLMYDENNFKFGNFKIGELEYVSNSLFSNIYIGKYRRPDGTVIWTDDYIREVYEAKMPFAVQNQLSIY